MYWPGTCAIVSGVIYVTRREAALNACCPIDWQDWIEARLIDLSAEQELSKTVAQHVTCKFTCPDLDSEWLQLLLVLAWDVDAIQSLYNRHMVPINMNR